MLKLKHKPARPAGKRMMFGKEDLAMAEVNYSPSSFWHKHILATTQTSLDNSINTVSTVTHTLVPYTTMHGMLPVSSVACATLALLVQVVKVFCAHLEVMSREGKVLNLVVNVLAVVCVTQRVVYANASLVTPVNLVNHKQL